jgi:transcriptional regulator with XRE-family HTH domain
VIYANNGLTSSTTRISRERIRVVGLVNGEKIVELRQKRRWSQSDLSAAAHVDHSVISRLERNLQPDCMLSIIIAIANALGVTVDELLVETEQMTLGKLSPELRAAIHQLAQKGQRIQRQAGLILDGYLASLEEDYQGD